MKGKTAISDGVGAAGTVSQWAASNRDDSYLQFPNYPKISDK